MEQEEESIIQDEACKRLILTYKKKSQLALQEVDQLKAALQEAKTQGVPAEQEKELESKRRLAEVLRKEKEQLEKKSGTLEKELFSVKTERDDALNEVKALALQFDKLKNQVVEAGSVKQEFDALKKKTSETEEANERLTKEVDFMQQALMKGMKEMNALKVQYQTVLQEKGQVMQKLSQMQQHMQQQRDVFLKQIEELRKKQELQSTAIKEQSDYQVLYEKEKVALQEKEQKIKELESKVTDLLEVKYSLQQKQENFDAAMREREADVKEAEQHLAKKVRESQAFLEQNQEQKTLIETLKQEVETKKGKIAELQANLDVKVQQEKRLEEQIERFEEKYLKASEKLQRLDAKVKEYKSLEEKHSQMKNLLSNLGNFIETEGQETPVPKKLQLRSTEMQKAAKEAAELDLFSYAKSPPRTVKETLFD